MDTTICNNKRWITRKSFELFLNAQNTYRIVSNEDKSGKEQEPVKIKEYISRQDAAKLASDTESTITKWMQLGKFTYTGTGKVLRIHRQEFI